MALGKRASGNAVIKAVMSNANGIGQSKTTARATSGVKGQNGQNISTKAHSISAVQNLRTVSTQYVNFVKDNYEGRVLENINNESIKDFIDSKLEDGVSGGTINTYISELGKFSDNLNQLGYENTNREEITAYRQELKEEGVILQGEHLDRAYDNAEQIVSDMYDNTPYGLSAELQYEAGLRADDALNSDKWTINEDNTLTITGSKGGVEYTTRELEHDLIERIGEAIENNYKGDYNEYRELLKETIGEDYNGTHGLRYNYAQERVEELRQQGQTESEALSQTSLEMGHSREEITLHYLG